VIATEFYGDGGAQIVMVEPDDIEALKQDIERHIQIASEQATEIERLRAALAHVSALAVLIGDWTAGVKETADTVLDSK